MGVFGLGMHELSHDTPPKKNTHQKISFFYVRSVIFDFIVNFVRSLYFPRVLRFCFVPNFLVYSSMRGYTEKEKRKAVVLVVVVVTRPARSGKNWAQCLADEL